MTELMPGPLLDDVVARARRFADATALIDVHAGETSARWATDAASAADVSRDEDGDEQVLVLAAQARGAYAGARLERLRARRAPTA